jgi:mannan endo-1,6-alpha-mannosidase
VLTVQDSIKKAAKLAAAGMVKWYTGYKPGDVPGNLPDPYYWWECGAMFNALIDYWVYTGDDQYNKIVSDGMQHQIGEYNAFMPQNQSKSLGNDDQGFWGMAALSAAEGNLPDLPKDQPSWLALAQAVFNTQAGRWNEKTCGGGLNWQIFPYNNGYDYKNTITAACFFNIAARLYKYTKDQKYLDWAKKQWDWEERVKLFDKPSGYYFYDGKYEADNCTDRKEPIQWTYNPAVHLAGTAAIWNAVSLPIPFCPDYMYELTKPDRR